MQIFPTTSVSDLTSTLTGFLTANVAPIAGLVFFVVSVSFIMAWFDTIKEARYLDGRLKQSEKMVARSRGRFNR